jgi:nitrite reductase/ring-hydroxylating ferredoxin subunit
MNDLATRVMEHAERDETQQLPSIYEFETTVYSDPDRFQRELALIFRRVPLLFGFTAELPKPGDYKAFEIAGVPVLVMRGEDGTARAFVNGCRHRGTPIAADGCGSAHRFTCPYHGWTYRNDGKLIGLPEPAKFGAVDMGKLGLVALPCEERAGMIFGILKPGAALDLDRFYGGLLEHLAQYRFETWTLMAKSVVEGANWKVAFDGYLESYHFAVAHRDTLAPSMHGGMSAYEAYGPHMHYINPMRSVGALRDMPKSERWRYGDEHFHLVSLLFPNISFSLGFNGVTSIAQVLPGPAVDQNRTVVYHLCASPPANDDEAREREAARDFMITILEKEDYDMGRRIQQGVNSKVPFTIRFGRNEVGNQYFHKWVQYYLDGDETAPKPTL